MEGVTDFSARLWFWSISQPDSMGTPFLRVTPTYPHQELPEIYAPELKLQAHYQLMPQLMASDAADFERIAPLILGGASVVEINCGCPAPKVVGNGGGSSLLIDVQRFAETMRRLSESSGPKKLAVKIRTGYDDDLSFNELISAIADLDLSRLTVHGRTKAQRYRGYSDWEKIEYAAQQLNFPVYGSGDICDVRTLAEKLKLAPSVTGVIVGRGAIRNPWLFRELRTGVAVTVSGNELIDSLSFYAHLNFLERNHPLCLVNAYFNGIFNRDTPHHSAIDSNVIRELCEYASTQDIDLSAEGFDRQTIGRTKMIWNYLRSSIPAAFEQPSILRAKTFSAMLDQIKDFWQSSFMSLENAVQLSYNPIYDRFYGKGGGEE